MKLSCLLTRLDRMPVLKLLVPFAVGIALALVLTRNRQNAAQA